MSDAPTIDEGRWQLAAGNWPPATGHRPPATGHRQPVIMCGFDQIRGETMPRFIAILCALLLLAVTAFAVPKTTKKRSDSGGTASFPRLVFAHRTLANGLQVYSIVDHSSPTVSIQVWYHVGSKDDPEGRSGLAHLLQHLLFHSTQHI